MPSPWRKERKQKQKIFISPDFMVGKSVSTSGTRGRMGYCRPKIRKPSIDPDVIMNHSTVSLDESLIKFNKDEYIAKIILKKQNTAF